ncbi:MAG: N-acetylmuramidase family protein [Alphaproteobacteria bacterium]|nr:MAG: N-acetylmuramidase family protein [Alphaproteobacteria bacterium]
MAAFRKDLTDLIRPNLAGGKFSPELVGGIDDILDRAGVPRDDGGALATPKAKPPLPPFRKAFTDLCRPHLSGGKFSLDLVAAIDAALDRAGVPRDAGAGAPSSPPPVAEATIPAGRLTVGGLRAFLGLPAAGGFDAAAQKALLARLAAPSPTKLTGADIARAAADLGVSAKVIDAVREVETKRASFDEKGRPTILFERHKFAANTVPKGRFNAAHPAISGGPYGSGGYGKFSAQYGKLLDACALDPEAALRACSWGAFQVLGENAVPIGYRSTLEMVLSLTTGEQAHLESFVRFVRGNHLADELRACRAGDPASCVPFVKAYNGSDFAVNAYHKKLAAALR